MKGEKEGRREAIERVVKRIIEHEKGKVDRDTAFKRARESMIRRDREQEKRR